jgi:hypothetical protein
MDIPAVTVRVDASGGLVGVEVEGDCEPSELIETQKSEPMAHFGDDEFRSGVRPWAAGG